MVGTAAVATTTSNSFDASRTTTSQATNAAPSDTDTIGLGDGIAVDTFVLPEGCSTYAMINITADSPGDAATGKLLGEPVDRGTSHGANGTANLDTDGNIVSYTVSHGDTLSNIGERLCMDEVYLASYNYVGAGPGEHVLQSGATLIVRPDPSTRWIPPQQRH